MACPQCGHPNPTAAKFCSNCGASLAVPCRACGHVNGPGSRFCNECGQPLTPAAPERRPAPQSYTPPNLADRILTSRVALEGERKSVTVLFADLKGSLELFVAERDPEEVRRLLDPVLEHMMEAVHHYEGVVNQVMGDGIMALFGAPIAHEDHAIRACYAALRMQERVGRYADELQRTHGAPLQMRVGLNSGAVVVRSIGSDLRMDYSAVGETTHLAARMEQMAKPGSILLTRSTLRLVEGYVRVRGLGAVPIRGVAEPVDVFELLGAAQAMTRLQVSVARGLTRFIGRDAELEQLRGAVERAGAGRGQVVAVVGEPGVGKSRLTWELGRSHRTDGWLVLESSAVSYGRGVPFHPVGRLVRHYLRIEDRDDERRVREKLTGKLLALDEALRPALPALQALLDVPVDDAAWKQLGGDAQRQRTIDAVKRVLLRESQAQPLLVVLEDLHWIDADTHALVESLVESVPSHRLLLLVNYRPEFQHGWGGKTYYGQIRLDPLAPASAEALVGALLGGDPELGPLTSMLISRAQGNPFFLEESVRVLAETGVLAGEPGDYRLAKSVQTVQLPDTVQAILAARIDRLPPEDKRLLQSAAVVGKDVPQVLLQTIADVPEADLLRGLARLQSAEFIYETRLFPDTEYTFKHTLTHEVAYSSLLHERRRALHARVVEAIERTYRDALAEHRDQLVHHALRGEVWSKAIPYMRDLAHMVAPEEIAAVIGRGPESPGQLWWQGEYDHAIKAAERDLAIGASFGNFAMRVMATCRLGQSHHALGHYVRAADLLRQVVTSLQGGLVHERFDMAAFVSVWARSWLALTLAELGEFEEAVTVADEGVDIATVGDHAYSRLQGLYGRGMVYVIRGHVDKAIAALEEGLVLSRTESIPFFAPFITAPLGAAYTLAGRTEAAITLLEQSIERAASMRLVASHSTRLTWLGEALLDAGRRDLALEHAGRALGITEERHERGQLAYTRHLLAEVHTRGEAAEVIAAEAAYQRALELAESLQMRPLAARCRLGLGRLHRDAGRKDLAREHVTAALSSFSAMGMTLWVDRANAELEASGG
jgi:class 3 adenylate cyclase/tetratricopeptide (TPR) repeat protein